MNNEDIVFVLLIGILVISITIVEVTKINANQNSQNCLSTKNEGIEYGNICYTEQGDNNNFCIRCLVPFAMDGTIYTKYCPPQLVLGFDYSMGGKNV